MRLDLDPWAIFGCNIAKWTILCIVVHFQPVLKLLQKGARVHHRRVILMQNFSGEGAPPPTPHPTPRRLDLNPSHSEILPTLLSRSNHEAQNRKVTMCQKSCDTPMRQLSIPIQTAMGSGCMAESGWSGKTETYHKVGEITNFLHAIWQGDYKSNQISSRLAGHIPTKFH